jgi:hypothetical protein
VEDIDVDLCTTGKWQASGDEWAHHLAMWAAARTHNSLPLDQCVVTMTAPELAGDQLVGISEMAEIGGVAESTLRAYRARGEADLPMPQALINGRPVWARPVVMEWAEERQRSPEEIANAVSRDTAGMPVGLSSLADRFGSSFVARLWQNPVARRRWALRSRNQDTVRRIADELALDAAALVREEVPFRELALSLKHALIAELGYGELERSLGEERSVESWTWIGIASYVAKSMGWIISCQPRAAAWALGELVGDLARNHAVPRHVTERSLRQALRIDSGLTREAVDDFLDRVLTPEADAKQA